jgi:aerobic-type carbon monoxide dehydrogenase small subunit (CoxS/CutS family)
MAESIELSVNGARHRLTVDPDRPLLSVLREELDITGPKYGCGEAQCGACTVLVDGEPRRSCITPVSAVARKQITTIEGLAKDGKLHPVQEAFLNAEALQCGYCTPGMILSAVALLRSNPNPTDQQIISYMNGNICRCGTYPRIVAAIHEAARAMNGGRK